MPLWFYIWIFTSIIFGIYIFRDYLKSPKYFKLQFWDIDKGRREDKEHFIPRKDWKTHLIVIAQWLFFTLVLGYILFIFN